MKLKQHSIAFATLIMITSATSCKKDCFDQALYDQYQVIDCIADCPGVTGCDGNFYCNECVANQHGIRVE